MTLEIECLSLNQNVETKTEELPTDEITRLQEVLQISQIAAWEWNVSTSQVCWFHNLEFVLGCTTEAVPIDYQAWVYRVHPDDRFRFNLEAIRALITHGDYVSDYRIILPDAKIQWLRNQGRICFDAGDQPTRVIGSTKKIDPPHRVGESAFGKSIDPARLQFMETVSHDFRTPLTIIQTATELLERCGQTCLKKQERFQQVYSAIDQIIRLLDEALARE